MGLEILGRVGKIPCIENVCLNLQSGYVNCVDQDRLDML